MAAAEDPIATFLAERTFLCTKLRTAMQPEICVKRQVKPTGRVEYGWGAGRIATPADKFCRSGECAQGQTVALGVKRKAAKPRARRR